MAGIARENVSRILNDWKRRKLFTRLSGYYCLEDGDKAETRCGDVWARPNLLSPLPTLPHHFDSFSKQETVMNSDEAGRRTE